LEPVQRWYRILSEALKRYLKGRQLDPPHRLEPLASVVWRCKSSRRLKVNCRI
jgi:hypothetical protein